MNLTRMTILALLLAAVPAMPEPGATWEGEEVVDGAIAETIDAYLMEAHQDGFAGCALVSVGGEILVAKGYGLANRAERISWTPKTIFTIGSITKQFTGAGIVTLAQQDKLDYQDKITTYFDNVPEDKRDITVHHLLTHSAGLKDVFGGDFDPRATRDWVVNAALDSRLRWPTPGVKHYYSNSGYSLLGAIIEKVSGKGYETYIKEALFKPAGMHDTGYTFSAEDQDRIAHGYYEDKHWGRLVDHPWLDDGPCWNLRANGGIMSTLFDLYHWHEALNGSGIISNESKLDYFGKHIKEAPSAGSYYGYGWAIAPLSDGSELIWHNGGNGIFFAEMRRYVKDDVLVVMASNVAGRSAEQYMGQVGRIARGIER